MLRAILAVVLACVVSTPALAQSAYPAPVDGDFVVRGFVFGSGDQIPEVKIHYRTVGTPRKDADGVVRIQHKRQTRSGCIGGDRWGDALGGGGLTGAAARRHGHPCAGGARQQEGEDKRAHSCLRSHRGPFRRSRSAIDLSAIG